MRSLIHPSQHAAVDSLLKSFKLVARRIQSVSTIHETELQILQRLYYKNKNQHRSAVFWRNISEIRRYSRRVVDLNLLENIQALRLSFHGSVRSVTINSVKGPWTHFPDGEHLLNISTQVSIAKRLATKMSEACSKAYSSCHSSLQSGAFLNVLLVVVAVTSRMGMIAEELKEICELSTSWIYDLLVISQALPSDSALVSNQNIEQGILDSATLMTKPVGSSRSPALKTSAIIIEQKKSSQPDRQEEILRTQPKKRKAKRDEIDDIFGS